MDPCAFARLRATDGRQLIIPRNEGVRGSNPRVGFPSRGNTCITSIRVALAGAESTSPSVKRSEVQIRISPCKRANCCPSDVRQPMPPGAMEDLRRVQSGFSSGDQIVVLRRVLAETLANTRSIPTRFGLRYQLTSRSSPIRSFSTASSRTCSSTLRATEARLSSSPRQRDEQVRISVEDAGPGIPDELRLRIFERFGRGQRPARQRPRSHHRARLCARLRR